MMNSYVEHVRQPVGRGVEKFLGWFAWIILLGITVLSLFAALVVLNNPENINRLETLINRLNINITTNGQLMSASEVALNIQNGIWLFIIYLIIVLIFSFIGLVLMRWRIFSAFVFLLLAIITIPLFIVLVPLFFFIVCILLFVRKDKILPVQGMAPQQPYYENQRENIQPQPRERQRVEPKKQYREEHVEESSHEKERSAQVDSVEQTETTHSEEVLSRSKKHQNKKQRNQQEETKVEDLDDANQSDINLQEDIGQRHEDPYNYETTQSDEYQVQPDKLKKEKKPKKVKPNATIERRNNYEKRMQQQKKYFEEKNKDEQNIDKNDNKLDK